MILKATLAETIKVKSGTIFTLSQADKLDLDDKTIFVRPAWQWLLEK